MPPPSRKKKRPPPSSSRRSPRPRATAQPSRPNVEGERLQKVLASAGAGSRRECEEFITAGRVEVDRKMVTELGTRVDPDKQEIRLDGMALPKSKLVYFAVNKPTGVVSTNRDPAGRPRVIDLVSSKGARLFTIGRLDVNSEGLILVTNDGELANRLTHPRYGVAKTYKVMVVGRPEPKVLAELRRGVRLAEAIAKVDQICVKSRHKDSAVLEIVLSEGRNREVRRVLAKVGHKVIRLVRTAVGPVRLGKLPPGEARQLTSTELTALRNASVGPKKKTSAVGPKKKTSAVGPKKKTSAVGPKKKTAAVGPKKKTAGKPAR